MGLYINGVEMPEHGEMLVIIQQNGVVKYKNSFGSQWTETDVIQVPPHGRLIDVRDILKNQHDVILKNGAKHRCFDTTQLSEIPTIIPAEEGET